MYTLHTGNIFCCYAANFVIVITDGYNGKYTILYVCIYIYLCKYIYLNISVYNGNYT